MKKKIIIFYPYINTFGGIEKLICTLADGIDLSLVCFYDKINLKKFNSKIDIVKLNPKHYLDKIFTLRNFFKKNLVKGYPLMWGYKASFFAYLAQLKNYAVFIDDPPSLLSSARQNSNRSFFKYIRKKIANYIDFKSINLAKHRITQTKRNAIELKNYFNCNFIFFYPGLKNKIFTSYQKPNKMIRLLSISRLEKSKNIEWIIRAIEKYKLKNAKNFKNIDCSIIGTGPNELYLKELIKNKSLEKNIKFKGFISEKSKQNFLKKNHVFLIPAVQGYGLPALEAISFSNKLIINKELRISELLKKNQNIFICKNNFADFYNKFEILINNKNVYRFNSNSKINLPKENDWQKSIYNICNWI